MSNTAVELGMPYLDAVDDPVAKQFVAAVQANNHLLSEDLARYKDQLVILDGNPANLSSPRILFCGKDTLASQEFSFEHRPSAKPLPCVFSTRYQSITSSGYLNSIHNNQIIIEYIECDDAVLGQHFPVSYVRAVAPITNGHGAWFIGVYSFRHRPAQYPKASSGAERLRPGRNQENTNLHMPYLPAVFSKPARQHNMLYTPT